MMRYSGWVPPRHTRGWSRDHRLATIAERAKDRTLRRSLALLAATEPGAGVPPAVIDRLDALIAESDELWIRLAAIPLREAELRRAWRVAA